MAPRASGTLPFLFRICVYRKVPVEYWPKSDGQSRPSAPPTTRRKEENFSPSSLLSFYLYLLLSESRQLRNPLTYRPGWVGRLVDPGVHIVCVADEMEKGAKAKDEGLCNGRVQSKEGVLTSANSGKETGRAKDLRPRGVTKQRRLILSDSESDEDLGGSGCFRIGGDNRSFSVDRTVRASPTRGNDEIADFEGTGPGAEDCKEKCMVKKGRRNDGDGDFLDNSRYVEKVKDAYGQACKGSVEGGEDRTGGHAECCEENSFGRKSGSKDAFTDDESLDKKIIPVSTHIVSDDNAADTKKNKGFPGIQEQIKAETLQVPDENVVGSYSIEGSPVGGKREREQDCAWLEPDLQHKVKKLLSSNDNSITSNINGVKVQFNSHRRAAEKRIKMSNEVSLQVKSDETRMKPHLEENDLGTSTVANGCKDPQEIIKSNDSSGSRDYTAPFYETLASRKARLCSKSMGVECGRSGSSSINSKTLRGKVESEGKGLSARGTQKTKTIEKDLCLKSSSKSEDEIGTSKKGKGVVTWDSAIHHTSPPVIHKATGELQKHGKTEQMQLVREKVKNMLLCAGWKIEQRPRRDKDYEDLVYVSPSGSGYWSIPNAYHALKKELDSIVEEGSFAHQIDSIKNLSTVQSLFYSFSNEELDILTRKRKNYAGYSQTKLKVKVGNIEKMKKSTDRAKSAKNVGASKGHKAVKGSPLVPFVKVKHNKSGKGAGANGCDIRISNSTERKAAINSKDVDGQSSNDHVHESHTLTGTSHKKSLKRQSFLLPASENLQGRKKKGKRNCTLMVRRSCKGENLGPDSDLIPYSGKQTILAWLIDSGTIQLNGKAKYWNKKHKRVLMEGHITRDDHPVCGDEDESVADFDSQLPSFCGNDCRKLFEQLKDLVGIKHDLDGVFSWTIVQRDGVPQCKLAERAECNSKVAVALSIMDECFMPIVDRRTSANLIHNIVYNCGSNFNRVNYSGFYTLLLEKGDEIISVASVRIHGTRLAEMPLIGTRYIYRRQGMCRRLITALESVLHRLTVKMLIIPAISDLLSTWTTVFGFKPLEESHRKELRRMNLMVFPGTDLLQKPILGHGIISDNSEKKLDDLQHVEDCPIENTGSISIEDTMNGSHFCQGENPTAETYETLVDDPAVSLSAVITEHAEVAAEASLLTTKESTFGFTAGKVGLKINNPESSEALAANVNLYDKNEGMTADSCLAESKHAAPEPCSGPSSKSSSLCASEMIFGLSKAGMASFVSPNDDVIEGNMSVDIDLKLNDAKSSGSVLTEDVSASVKDAKCRYITSEVALAFDVLATDNAVFDCPIEKVCNYQGKHPGCVSESGCIPCVQVTHKMPCKDLRIHHSILISFCERILTPVIWLKMDLEQLFATAAQLSFLGSVIIGAAGSPVAWNRAGQLQWARLQLNWKTDK
ncbi:Increased DNA methylation 1 [Nymphaea thermarum]|nr:Increased DNA methylation 1 [Nymphaea thermarum]